MKIFDLCASERPREKMLCHGASALGNSELLAILLRSGTPEESALDLANKLLSSVDGSLCDLFQMSAESIGSIKGIGPCKATSILAAFELGKRFLQEEASAIRKPVVASRSIYEVMIPFMKGLGHEECWAVFLNERNYITGKEKVNIGALESTVIDVRRIVRRALERNASGIIIVHNHPSGSPQPSTADIKVTEAMHNAADACSLSLVDHVIIANDSFFSFAEEKTYKG